MSLEVIRSVKSVNLKTENKMKLLHILVENIPCNLTFFCII